MNDGDEEKENGSGAQAGSDEESAAKASDAAVRRVLVESYRDLSGFLQRRLGADSDEAAPRFRDDGAP